MLAAWKFSVFPLRLKDIKWTTLKTGWSSELITCHLKPKGKPVLLGQLVGCLVISGGQICLFCSQIMQHGDCQFTLAALYRHDCFLFLSCSPMVCLRWNYSRPHSHCLAWSYSLRFEHSPETPLLSTYNPLWDIVLLKLVDVIKNTSIA